MDDGLHWAPSPLLVHAAARHDQDCKCVLVMLRPAGKYLGITYFTNELRIPTPELRRTKDSHDRLRNSAIITLLLSILKELIT